MKLSQDKIKDTFKTSISCEPIVYDRLETFIDYHKAIIPKDFNSFELNSRLRDLKSTLEENRLVEKDKLIELRDKFLLHNTGGYGRGTILEKSLYGIACSSKTEREYYKSIRFEDIVLKIKKDVNKVVQNAIEYPASNNLPTIKCFERVKFDLFVLNIKEVTSHYNYLESQFPSAVDLAFNAVEELDKLYEICLNYKEIACNEEAIKSLINSTGKDIRTGKVTFNIWDKEVKDNTEHQPTISNGLQVESEKKKNNQNNNEGGSSNSAKLYKAPWLIPLAEKIVNLKTHSEENIKSTIQEEFPEYNGMPNNPDFKILNSYGEIVKTRLDRVLTHLFIKHTNEIVKERTIETMLRDEGVF